jgi:two-component system, chemotaxis family, chemotaxis protein CheY
MSKSILIADDDAGIRSIIRTFVEVDGYRACGEAADGIEAVERAKELQPEVILLDLSMPRLNGAETAGILRREMPRARIVLFTMYADDFGEKLASEIGVHVVLSKPEGLSTLGEHLKRCSIRTSRQRYLDLPPNQPRPTSFVLKSSE